MHQPRPTLASRAAAAIETMLANLAEPRWSTTGDQQDAGMGFEAASQLLGVWIEIDGHSRTGCGEFGFGGHGLTVDVPTALVERPQSALGLQQVQTPRSRYRGGPQSSTHPTKKAIRPAEGHDLRQPFRPL